MGSVFAKASPKSSAAFNKFVQDNEIDTIIRRKEDDDQSDKEYTNHEEMMQVLSDRFEVSGRNFDMQLGGSSADHQTVRTVSEKVMTEIRER